MRISDWSSDVCSSDLLAGVREHAQVGELDATAVERINAHGRRRFVGKRGRDVGCQQYGHEGSGSEKHVGLHFGVSRKKAFVHSFTAATGTGCAGITPAQRNCSRSEEHTSELQSLMRISYAVFCLKKKKNKTTQMT